MKKIVDTVSRLARPVVERHECQLWDVEFVKEGGQWYLRVYIDKPEGVSIDDCEAISRELDGILDEADPIPNSYTFEVSSAGAERALKRPSDFEQFMGPDVEVKLYGSKNGQKESVGKLRGYDGGAVEIESGRETLRFEKQEVAQVRLHISL